MESTITLSGTPYTMLPSGVNEDSLRVLVARDVSEVKGGLSAGSVSGGKNSTPAPKPTLVNIHLQNIPYVNQYIANNRRSNNYCGIASALMVRSKNTKGTSEALNISRLTYELDMETIDRTLQNGYYCDTKVSFFNVKWNLPVDVVSNGGLLYLSTEAAPQQFEKTVWILSDLYNPPRISVFPSDGVSSDRHHVSDVAAKIHRALDMPTVIWDHIKENRQPVVILIDSNKVENVKKNKMTDTWLSPTLHYVVVFGIYESGNVKWFSIRDPADSVVSYDVNEWQLQYLMTMPRDTPAWVYTYPYNWLGMSDPSYALLVKGD